MIIQTLGHACFRITAGGYAIVLDPYKDGMIPGLRPLHVQANAVLCSHQHGDHGYVQAVTIVPAGGPSPFTITRVQSAHDDQDGAKRGMNTIHVLDAEGLRVCHLGDLGTMLTAAQVEAIGPVDAVCVPTGGYYTIDAITAKAVCDALSPRMIVPMHFRSIGAGLEELDTLDTFLSLYEGDVTLLESDTFTLTKHAPRGVVVPQYQ